jgi:transcriptional regulator of acetoin/glycerol metabolism
MFEVAIAMREQESEIHLAYQAMIERTPLRLLTREKLFAVLRHHRGNKSRVAKELQITRATLYRWMATHGLDSAEF